MKRIAFIAHYDNKSITSRYIFHLLNEIRSIYDCVYFVSNCSLNDSDRQEISGIVDVLLERKNSGYDFAAWKDAILQLGWEELSHYDNVTFLNTSCFGPIFPLSSIYEYFENKHDIDFWGLTNFRESRDVDWYPGGIIPEHIQSYFICVKNRAVKSGHLRSFFSKISTSATRDEVVQSYETRLTQYLQDRGYNYQCVFDTTQDTVNRGYTDYSRYNPDLCIDAGVPFVKIKAFLPDYNRSPQETFRHISSTSNYPVELIEDYFRSTSSQALRYNAIKHLLRIVNLRKRKET